MTHDIYREYTSKKFLHSTTKAMILKARDIIQEYAAQGYDLTLRQLYYQFVSRDLLANSQRSYDNLGTAINTGRLMGLIPWNRITDRTRNLASQATWDSPQEIINAVARQYRRSIWEDQPAYVEVWVEKEALANVVERAAHALGVSYFSCRGYVSQSEMWAAGMRMKSAIENGKEVHIFHLGDHDPSGIDMTRDIQTRLSMFVTGEGLEEGAEDYTDMGYRLRELPQVHRIALNMPQIRQYQPPPNPAKMSDSRFKDYMAKFGHQSWELDALEPQVLEDLILDQVRPLIDVDLMDAAKEKQAEEREGLLNIAGKWDDLQDILTHWDEVKDFMTNLDQLL